MTTASTRTSQFMWISPWTQARTGKAPHPKPHSFRFLQFSMLKVSTKCAQLGKSLAPEKPGINISKRDYKIFRLLPASTNWNASKQDRLRVGHGSMSCVVLWYDDSELSSTLHFGRQLSAQLAFIMQLAEMHSSGPFRAKNAGKALIRK